MKFVFIFVSLLVAFNAMAMERNIVTEQRKVRMINVKLSSAGVVSGLDKFHVTGSKTSTGTYEIVPTKIFARDVQAIVNAKTAGCRPSAITETVSKVTVVMASTASTSTIATDCAFNLSVIGSDTTEVN